MEVPGRKHSFELDSYDSGEPDAQARRIEAQRQL